MNRCESNFTGQLNPQFFLHFLNSIRYSKMLKGHFTLKVPIYVGMPELQGIRELPY
jgi:hypothetical protein